MCVSWTISKVAKLANSRTIGAREMTFGLLGGGKDGEHAGVGFIFRYLKYL